MAPQADFNLDRYSDEGPTRLAEAVRARRGILRLSQDNLPDGPSKQKVSEIESGKYTSFSSETLFKLCKSLGWKWPDSIDQALQDEEPVTLEYDLEVVRAQPRDAPPRHTKIPSPVMVKVSLEGMLMDEKYDLHAWNLRYQRAVDGSVELPTGRPEYSNDMSIRYWAVERGYRDEVEKIAGDVARKYQEE